MHQPRKLYVTKAPAASIDDMQQSPHSTSHTSPILSPSLPTISPPSSSSLQQSLSDQQSLDTHLLHTSMNNTRLSIRTLLNITESQQMRIVIHNRSFTN